MLTQGDLRRPLRRAAALAPVMLLATLAAACGPAASPAPSPTPPPPAAASATTTPSPTATTPSAPSLPEQVESEAGAVAMMRYVFELYTYAFATNDASGFEAIGAKDCNFCANVRDNVETNRAAGHVINGGAIAITRLTARPIDNQGYFSIRATIRQAQSVTEDHLGAVVSTSDAAKYSVRAGLRWQGDRWSVLEVEAEPSQS